MTPTRYLCLVMLLVPSCAVAQLAFTEVEDPFGLPIRSWGASWVDADGDLDLDLFVSRQATSGGNRLFRNTGSGFEVADAGDLTASATPGSLGHTWADFDNDGDLDVYAVGGWVSGAGHLFSNDGDGTFSIIEGDPIGPEAGNLAWSAAWGDIDADGLVDLVLAHPVNFLDQNQLNHLFHNQGDGAFTRITDSPIVTGFDPYTVPSWSDYDLDGDLDLFIGSGPATGSVAPDNLYENDGTGTFTRITTDPIATDARDGQVMNWIDYDNDGDLDLYVTNYFGTPTNDLYRNDDGTYVPITTGPLATDTGGLPLANTWGDLDNDGDLDVLVTTGGPATDRLYTNNGDGTFTRITDQPVGSGTTTSSGATLGDYDFDGDLDLAVTTQTPTGGPVRLYRNEADNGNGWLKLNLIGGTSNRAAIGAKVRATAMLGGEAVTQFREVSAQNTFNGQNALTVHFGLGDAEEVDALEITWPSGAVDMFTDVRRNAFFEVTEGGDLFPVAGEADGPAESMSFALDAPYPNPFAATTTLRYTLGVAGAVRLAVFDVLGRRVRTLVDAVQPAGSHTATWSGADEAGRSLRAGLYLVRLEAEGQVMSRRLVLVR